jgi:hypothetical protein
MHAARRSWASASSATKGQLHRICHQSNWTPLGSRDGAKTHFGHESLAKMNNVISAYQEAVSTLVKLHSECKNNLPPDKFDGANRILNDVQRRLSKIEPMLKES